MVCFGPRSPATAAAADWMAAAADANSSSPQQACPNSWHWQLQDLALHTGTSAMVTAVAAPAAGPCLLCGLTAWHLTLIIWTSLVLPHLVTGLWIMWMDLSGQLEPYRLHRPSKTGLGSERIAVRHKYWKCIPSLCRDFLVLLPPILYIVCSACTASLVTVDVTFPGLLSEGFKLVAAYLLGRMWAMAARYTMHLHPVLYKHIHKAHHVGLYEMCALAAWRDHPLEFLLMEVPSIYLIGIVVFRLNVFSVCLMCAYHGISAAIDHSGFHAGSVLDGRYHFVHHALVNTNYGELEWLDRICGTYVQYKLRL